MKGAFVLAALFLVFSVWPSSSCALESCTDLGNMLRSEVKDPSKLTRTFNAYGVQKCSLFAGETMCFECTGGILYTQRNPKTGMARVGQGCPCKSKR